MAKIKLGAEGLEEFYKLRVQRLESIPLDLLNTASMVRPQGHSEKEIIEQTLEIEKILEKEKTPERKQKQVSSSKPLDMDINIDPKLIKELE